MFPARAAGELSKVSALEPGRATSGASLQHYPKVKSALSQYPLDGKDGGCGYRGATPDARQTFSLWSSARGLNVPRRPVLPTSLRLRLRRVVARRNQAVIKYRRLAKASVAEKGDAFERFIARQLAEIARLEAEIAELRAIALPGGREISAGLAAK
jgi:hypothetical protein